MWDDVDELCTNDPESSLAEHFIGAVVTAPAHSVPEGVTKYLLIDGQQRLTTLFLFLAALRDRAKIAGDEKLAARIQQLYLTNSFQEESDRYKLLPTQGNDGLGDRSAYIAIVDGKIDGIRSGIGNAYHHFHQKLRY